MTSFPTPTRFSFFERNNLFLFPYRRMCQYRRICLPKNFRRYWPPLYMIIIKLFFYSLKLLMLIKFETPRFEKKMSVLHQKLTMIWPYTQKRNGSIWNTSEKQRKQTKRLKLNLLKRRGLEIFHF
jgi:hypothetical protein